MKKFRNLFIYFILYCFLGWIYETVLEVCIYKWGFSNRGVLFGPVLPVYGFGALIFLLAFNKKLKSLKVKQKILYIPVVFLGCMFLATALELVTSYICEFFMGSWPWNYAGRFAYSFQGRIALNPSIRFGIGSIFFLYIMQPLFELITDKVPDKILNVITIIILCLFGTDLIYSFLIK